MASSSRWKSPSVYWLLENLARIPQCLGDIQRESHDPDPGPAPAPLGHLGRGGDSGGGGDTGGRYKGRRHTPAFEEWPWALRWIGLSRGDRSPWARRGHPRGPAGGDQYVAWRNSKETKPSQVAT